MKNKKDMELELPVSLWVAKHVYKNSFFQIYHLGNFDDLIQSGF